MANDDPVTIVSGFGRCGSSLVMQMLYAAGMKCAGPYPAFEPQSLNPLHFDAGYLAFFPGGAGKILNPQLIETDFLPGAYRSIWLDRDAQEQSASMAKFNQLIAGLITDRAHRRRIAKSYAIDRPKALRVLRGLGPVMELRFEDLIENSVTAAARIVEFCELRFVGPRDLAGAVLPRTSAAQPGMDIELSLIERGGTWHD